RASRGCSIIVVRSTIARHSLSSADSSQQRLRLAQIAGTMPLGEPRRGRLQQGTRLYVPLLAFPQPRKAPCGTQFQRSGRLRLGTRESLNKTRFCTGGISRLSKLQKFACRAMQFRIHPVGSSGRSLSADLQRLEPLRDLAAGRMSLCKPGAERGLPERRTTLPKRYDAGLQFGNTLARPSALDQELATQSADGRAPPRRPQLLADLQQFRGRRFQELHVTTIRCK